MSAPAVTPVSPTKVYPIYGAMYASGVGMLALFSLVEAVRSNVLDRLCFIREDTVVATLILVISLLLLCFSKAMRVTVPFNYIMLTFFTFVVDYLFALSLCLHEAIEIIGGIILSLGIIAACSVIAWSRVVQMMKLRTFLTICLMGLLVFACITAFFLGKAVLLIIYVIFLALYIPCLILCTEFMVTKDPYSVTPDDEYIFQSMYLYVVSMYILFCSIMVVAVITS